MRLRSLLAGAALAGSLGIGSIAMAGTASASETHPVQCYGQQCDSQGSNGNCQQGDRTLSGSPYGQQYSQDNKSCNCKNETVTFDFAPNKGARDGTWLLETGGPALYDGETLTYHGTTWTVEDWTVNGHGTLHNGDYFILVKDHTTLTGSLSENPQTAWITQQVCTTSNPNPCPCNTGPCGHITLGSTLDSYGNQNYDNQNNYGSLCGIQIPCKPVTLPCRPIVRDPQPCKPVLQNDPRTGSNGHPSYIG